jgi:hypothetical protein
MYTHEESNGKEVRGKRTERKANDKLTKRMSLTLSTHTTHTKAQVGRGADISGKQADTRQAEQHTMNNTGISKE